MLLFLLSRTGLQQWLFLPCQLLHGASVRLRDLVEQAITGWMYQRLLLQMCRVLAAMVLLNHACGQFTCIKGMFVCAEVGCCLPLRLFPAGAELSAAIAAWQQRHQLAAVLSTGFLDGSHPIVDAYELGVRLQHMLRRLTALAAGALVQVGDWPVIKGGQESTSEGETA